MKKISLILAFVLAAAMAVLLTGCSVDIVKDDGEKIHVDINEILESIDFEGLEKEIESIDWEGIGEGFSEGVESIMASAEEFLGSIDIDQEKIYEFFESFGASEGGYSPVPAGETDDQEALENFLAENGFTGDLDEALNTLQELEDQGKLQEIMEENGYGEYYDMVVSEVLEGPDWVKDALGAMIDGEEFVIPEEAPTKAAAEEVQTEAEAATEVAAEEAEAEKSAAE